MLLLLIHWLLLRWRWLWLLRWWIVSSMRWMLRRRRHAQKVIVNRRTGRRRRCPKIQQGSPRSRSRRRMRIKEIWSRRIPRSWGGSVTTTVKQHVQMIARSSRNIGRCMRRRSSCWNGRRRSGGSDIMTSSKVILVIIIFFFHTQSSHLGDYAILPSGHRLRIFRDIHPNGHGSLFSVGTGKEGTLEPKVVVAGQGKGVTDRLQCRWRSGLSRFGCQKDIGVQLFVAIFGNKIPTGTSQQKRETEEERKGRDRQAGRQAGTYVSHDMM